MLAAIIGYILVLVAVFGRALVPPDGLMIFGDDIHRQYYFYRQFFNYWLGQGIFSWWNPYFFSGEPFIANPVVNIWYPANWLFIFLPLNIVYSWHLAFHVFWAMLGMRMLVGAWDGNDARIGHVRRTTSPLNETSLVTARRLTSLSAWISGLIFGLSGFFMARTWAGHVDVIAAASWMPWVMWAFVRLVRAEVGNPPTGGRLPARDFVVAAVVFAIQLLAGYQTMAFMTAITVAIVILFNCYIAKSFRPLVRGMLAGIGGLGLAAFHLLPVAEFFRQSIRTYAFPYAWHSYGSIEWRSLLQLINPFQFGNQYTYSGPPPNFVEHSYFIGIGGLAMVVVAIVWSIKRMISEWSKRIDTNPKTIRFYSLQLFAIYSLIAVFGLWVSLGPNAPVDLQYFLWKTVPMYHYLRIPARHLILVVFGLAGLAGIGFGVVFQVLKGVKYLKVLIVGGVLLEMVWFGRVFIELRPLPEARHDKELIALLKQDKDPYRLLQNFGVWIPPRDALDFDSVMSYRLFSATGYDPSILRNYYEFVANAAGKKGEQAVLEQDVQVPYLTAAAGEALDFLNIKYILVPPLYDPFSGNSRYRLVREDLSKQYRLYENTTVWPRFYLADRSCGTVNVSAYTPNRIKLTVETSCDTQLMSSEVWYPGWEAYVDGKRTSISKTNDAFRTLFVSSGKHEIVYQYFPKIFAIGGIVSVATLVVLLWFLRKPHLI